MTDDDNYLQGSRTFQVRAQVTALMLKGAGYAALLCGGVLIVAFVLLGISAVLPEASKQAPDPMPDLGSLASSKATEIA